MAFTYDVTTPRGQVRLLLNDVAPVDACDEFAGVFDDHEIDAFLALEGGSVKRAAAQAIDTNATDQALASKVLRTQDLTTDGAKLADAMRKHADRLRAQADAEDEDAESGFFFGVVDIAGSAHSRPELTAYPYRGL